MRTTFECKNLSSAFQAAERAWTRAISIAPRNPNAYGNRGTARLQAGRCETVQTSPVLGMSVPVPKLFHFVRHCRHSHPSVYSGDAITPHKCVPASSFGLPLAEVHGALTLVVTCGMSGTQVDQFVARHMSRWAAARDDLQAALDLETAEGQQPSGLTLNNLGAFSHCTSQQCIPQFAADEQREVQSGEAVFRSRA